MNAIYQPTTFETGASPFKAWAPAGLAPALGLALAAWFSFALAAQAADTSFLQAAPTNSWKNLAVTNALGAATNAVPASPSTGAETRPLTPQEWLQRGFPERTNVRAGQARILTTERQRAPAEHQLEPPCHERAWQHGGNAWLEQCRTLSCQRGDELGHGGRHQQHGGAR